MSDSIVEFQSVWENEDGKQVFGKPTNSLSSAIRGAKPPVPQPDDTNYQLVSVQQREVAHWSAVPLSEIIENRGGRV